MATVHADELVEVEVAWLGARPRDPRQPAVIDLTDLPDSPPSNRPPRREPSTGSLRSRRTNSQRRSPPTLNRTDSITMTGGNTVNNNNGPGGSLVIDLTREQSPDLNNRLPLPVDPAPTLGTNGNLDHLALPNLAPTRRRPPTADHRRPLGANFLPNAALDYINAFALLHDGPGRSGRIRNAPPFRYFMNEAPFEPAIGGLHLNYQRAAFTTPPAPPPPPPPPKMTVPPAREGFTRDTGEDVVVICPACSGELEYDPSGGKEDGLTGKKRAKREKGEHHFWAVKACGHVSFHHFPPVLLCLQNCSFSV